MRVVAHGARNRLGALGLLAMAVLTGCQPAANDLAAPRAGILIVKGTILQAVLAHDHHLAGSFAGHKTYVAASASSPPSVLPLPETVTRTAVYTSFAAFAGDMAAGRLPGSVRAVMYDPEKWAATPIEEQRNPRLFMLRFSRLARTRALEPILAPARDLVLVPGGSCVKQRGENLTQGYIRCGFASADTAAGVLVVQSQVEEFDTGAFRRFLAVVVSQARAGNPRIAVVAGLATAPVGREASLAQLVAAARSVRGLVQGFNLNARPSDIPTAAALLRALKR